MIEIKNLHKSFGDQHVLRGVNLSIPANKTTVILGPSGEGKSVLLKHLIGLIHPDQGEIWIDGQEITKMNEKELNVVRRKIGMLFQDAALFDDMTVFENVSFPLYEHTTLSDDEVAAKVEEHLLEVGLKDVNHKLPSELSGGMRKRVGLARALMLEPKILYFDEPTTGLDPVMTEQIAELIEETHEKHQVTMVIISHDMEFSYRLADEMAMLAQGKILEVGPPTQFRNSTNPFVRKFLSAHHLSEARA